MDLSSRLVDATRPNVGDRAPGNLVAALLVLCGVVASILIVAASTTDSASAQSSAIIVPNVSTTAPYAGPDVVLSGTASSPNAIVSVTAVVQDTTNALYVQDAAGTLGLNPVVLKSFTALLPPPGDMSVSWRVPLQLADGSYAVTITATEATATSAVTAPIAFTVQESVAIPPTEFIAQDAVWSYYDLGEAPPAQGLVDWFDPAYDTSTWLAGPAQLGYGGADTTTIAAVDATGSPVIAAYFRHDFTVVDPTAVDEIALTMLRDDGAVIYVNGQEWARSNMKDVGPIRYTNLAKTVSNAIVEGTIDPSLLVVGQNNISVEVHQASLTSSDISFWLSMIGSSATVASLESDARPGTYVLTAGDMARCGHDGDEIVAAEMNELFDTDAGVFIGLGDLVYNRGTVQEFANCYEPTMGEFKDVTWPSPGNHEHLTTPNAAGYRNYFGEAAGPLAGPAGGLWYSFDIDEYWHVIALDSDCRGAEVLPGAFLGDGCAVGSEQEIWLRADLEANADKNILAFFHHPPYTNNHYTDHEYTWPLWQALTEYGADITLHGHEHHYERYTPMNIWGEPDAQYGAREFIIGSGGTYPRYDTRTPDTRSEFKGTFPNGTFDYGVLQLWLRPDGYDWKWEPILGLAETDEGTSGLADPYPVAAISGTVTSSGDAAPIAGVDVCVVAARDNAETCAVTTAAGTFEIPALFADDYTITYTDPTEAHVGQTADIALTALGATTSVVLEELRFMRGRLTADGLGTALEGGEVCATSVPAGTSGCGIVAADGSWEISGLQAGDYEVEFAAAGFRTECYFNNEGCTAPAIVTILTSTDRTGVNAGMRRQDGDVNCDGILNILDAFTMAQYSVELRTDNGPCPLTDTNTKIYLGNGDSNLDGSYNIVDAFGLAECAVGLASEFCP